MSQTVAAFMLDRLKQWGVTRIYGYPGDGINGLLGAFHEFEDDIDFVQTRHEEIAAFAACAHGKLTGEVGVCMATSGPGAIHLLNGLYDAKLDHAPVVAIVGQQARMALGSNFQQEVDLTTLFKDVASEYVQMCMAARAGRAPDRPRHADRQGDPVGDLRDRAQRHPGGRVLRAAARPRRGPVVGRIPGAGDPPPRRGPEARRRRAQRR